MNLLPAAAGALAALWMVSFPFTVQDQGSPIDTGAPVPGEVADTGDLDPLSTAPQPGGDCDNIPKCDIPRLLNELILARSEVLITHSFAWWIHEKAVIHLRAIEEVGGLPLTPLPSEGHYQTPLTTGADLGCELSALRAHLNAASNLLEQIRGQLHYRKDDRALAALAFQLRSEHLNSLQRVANEITNPTLGQEIALATAALELAATELAAAQNEVHRHEVEYDIRVRHLQSLQRAADVCVVSDGGVGNGAGGY